MRILKGHDYYDGGGWGQDPDILFVRDAKTLHATPFQNQRHLGQTIDMGHITEPGGYRSAIVMMPTLILFAGQIFPCVVERTGNVWPLKDLNDEAWREFSRRDTPTHHDLDSVLERVAFLRENSLRHDRRPPTRNVYLNGDFVSIETLFTQHFARQTEPGHTAWMVNENIVTGVLDVRDGKGPKSTLNALVNGDFLGALDFFKVKDAATAHRDIAQYIGGVLPRHPKTVSLSDTSKRQKAGFDDRSFKQDPGVKKPRRRGKTQTVTF